MSTLEEMTQQLATVEQRVTALAGDLTTVAEQGRRTHNLAEQAGLGTDELVEVATEIATNVADLVDRHEQLTRRIDALQADQFSMAEQIRLAASAADRAVVGLDEIEEILTEIDERSGETAATFDAAMRQRDAVLGHGPPTSASGAPGAAPGAPPADSETEGDVQGYPALDLLYGWVADHITPLVRRVTATGEGGGIRWCRQWWLHHDAIERFTALYLVWDELSNEDSISWLSAYLRDHLDPHLATLTSPYGPFYACSPRHHSDTASPIGQDALDPHDDGVLDDAILEDVVLDASNATSSHGSSGMPRKE